jgi:hypothetical protein
VDDFTPYFQRYAEAFEAFDADAIAACFTTPCLFVRDGSTEAASTVEAVTASVEALLALHRAWDVQTVHVTEVAVLETGPGHTIARVRWALSRAANRVPWTYATTYTLVPAGADWRIAVAITHDAPF